MASAVGFCRLSGVVCREPSLGATVVVQVRAPWPGLGAGRLVLVCRQPLRRASLPPSQPSLTHTFTRPGI